MKRVAIIGADFAPSSLPPATRIRFFAKHLPEFGWEPIVLTTNPEYYDWPVDSENERLLPETLNVVRTSAWRSSWTRKIGIGDVGMRSLWHQWQALKRTCRETRIDLVFIPVPPSVPMVLGRMAYQKFGIPYVVDYIDPWVTEYYWKLPKNERPPKWPLAYAMARVLEPFALRKVSHITGVSKGTTDSVVSRYPQLSEGDATEIPYGAEPTDFDYLRRHPRSNAIFDKRDGLFHLSHVGACIPGMYPTVRALFQAICLGLDSQPQLFSRLRLHFVGTSYSANGAAHRQLPEIAREFGVAELVSEQPTRVSYLDSLQIMLDSNGLFLIGSDEPHYTASKVFPYLFARRPLLAIFHEQSSVIKILNENRTGQTVSFNSTYPPSTRCADILGQVLGMLQTRPTSEDRRSLEGIDRYTARTMTGRLSGVFEAALISFQKRSKVFTQIPAA